MTAVVQTLNCTVGEIEELLAKGVPVEQIARDLQEPRQNVVAVWDRWRKNGAVTLPPPTAPRPVAVVPAAPATPTPQGHRVDESAITVNALVAAAGRSTSKRTQALGVRLADLAKVVRDRLAEERTAAEQAERGRAERERAAAEVTRLEAQLREARAKLRGRRAGGGSAPMPREAKPRTASQLANLAGGRVHGQFPCRHDGCTRVLTTAAARGSHERNCGGAS